MLLNKAVCFINFAPGKTYELGLAILGLNMCILVSSREKK